MSRVHDRVAPARPCRAGRRSAFGAGLRLHVLPVTTAIMVAARNDPMVEALPEGASKEEQALVMAKAVARRVVTGWEGVGDAAGKALRLTPEAVERLMDLDDIAAAFWDRATGPVAVVAAEGNG